jgi:hypothetical protein
MVTFLFPIIHYIAGFLGLALYGVGSVYYSQEQEFHAIVAILFSVWWLDFAFLEKQRLRYLLIPFLSVVLYGLVGSGLSHWVIGQALVLCALLGGFLEWRTLRDNQELFTRNLYRFVLIFISALAGLIIFSLSAGFFFALETLFGLLLPHGIKAISQLVGAVVFVEAFAYLQNQNRFGFLREENLTLAYSKICAMLLFPFFALYTGLLALYELKLLLTWESPRGYASVPATVALAIWFLLIPDQKPNNRVRDVFVRYFSFIAVALLIYGVGLRVSEHGLTPERIYGLFWALISLFSTIAYAKTKELSLKYPAFMSVFLLGMSLIPGIQVVNFQGSYIPTAEINKNRIANEVKAPACLVLIDQTTPIESAGLPKVRVFSSDGDYIELKDPSLQMEIDRKSAAFTLKFAGEAKVISLLDEKLHSSSGPWVYDVQLTNRHVRVVITLANLCPGATSSYSGLVFY